MFSFIYLGFLLLVLGFFAHYIFHRFEEQNHKIKTLGKILTSITAEFKDIKTMNNNQLFPNVEEELELQLNEEEEQEVVIVDEQENTKTSSNSNINSTSTSTNIKKGGLETINTNTLCIVSDDDTDYEDDDGSDEESECEDEDEDSDNVLKCNFMQSTSGGGGGGVVGRIDPFTLMSIFAGAGTSGFQGSEGVKIFTTASYHNSAFDIDENVVETFEEVENVQENVEENVEEEVQNVKEEENIITDYKKMSVEQLRKCVTSKGLTTKVSKLKKMELVELLENN
jgi:hypothetical protein